MSEKLRNHVNILFAAAPKTAKAEAVKENLLTKLNTRHDELLAGGYDSAAAFHIALSEIGDMKELLKECGGAVQANPVVLPKPVGTGTTVVLTKPTISKVTRIALYLGLAVGLPVIGIGLVPLYVLVASAPGLGVFLMFLCWAASPVFFLLAIAAMFSLDSRQAEESYQKLVLSQAEYYGFSKEFVQNELRSIRRQNRLRSAVFILLIVLLPFFLLRGIDGIARGIDGVVQGMNGIGRFMNEVHRVDWFRNIFIPTGLIVEQEREISDDFSLINIQSAIPVVFKLSDKNLVVVETHEDMMPFIHTTVKNNSLTIHQSPRRYHHVKKLHVTVYCQKIPSAFFVSGVSSLTFEEPMAMESVSFDCSGAGKIHVNNLECEKLSLRISGASLIDISGKSESVLVQGSGAARLQASDFVTNVCDASISGASNVEFGTINTELSVSTSGASQFCYGGIPAIKKQEVSGASKVIIR